MYTRCPSCSCTYRVTATVLQMAEGEVRCGSCGAVFNALHTLVDDWSGAGFTLPGAPRLVHPDAPLQPPAASPGDEAEPDASETLEFDVPETEWQHFFVPDDEAPAARAEPGLGPDFEPGATANPEPGTGASPDGDTAGEPADEASEESPDDTREQRALPTTLEAETADTDTWQTFLRETAPEAAEPDAEGGEAPLFVIGEDGARDDQVGIWIRRPPEADDFAESEPETSRSGPDGLQGIAPADREAPPEADDLHPVPAAPDSVLDWGPPPAFSERAPRAPAHTGRWLAASAVAAVLLAAQGLHSVRDRLAADPAYGPPVRELYHRLGWPLYPAWPLDSYEIRDTKAIAERSAPGALDIVAEIAVTGRQPVGLPMVRVVLRDRWSNAVASGVFDAGHYLAEAPSSAPTYAPGTLIPVEISLKDPGSSAQGYELDVCVPDRKLGLQCKSARDPFRR